MTITKYGYNTIYIVSIICFVLIVAGIFTNNIYGKSGLFILSGLLMVFTLNFFRDPERITPQKKNIIVTPADGKVIIVKKVSNVRYLNAEGWQISVFMSPLNVHVNRIPIDGTVESVKYIQGQYIAAFEDKASEVNERSEIGIASVYGKVLFTQVAGYVARRIVYNLTEGQKVSMGERFGMIRFGSRVDVFVPLDWEPSVKVGDIVSAGETQLFTHQ
ncbi:MAG: phosphatidylserine decarboxylase family protein [Ignavibacteriales bacterium]|nr:phosphatidylserine decarboxylase family protein [Ignavibacteriales bacterium]